MDRLSSCYFCGTALDEPLQDYPLVAGDTGEHGAVVTLCPGCHHKLETVLDVVVGESEDWPALEDTDRVALEGEEPAALTEPSEGGSTPDPIALGDGEEDTPARSTAEGSDGASDAGRDDVDGTATADETGSGRDIPADAGGAGDDGERDIEPLGVEDVGSGTEGETDARDSNDRRADGDPDTDPADTVGAEADRDEVDGGDTPGSEEEGEDRTTGETGDGATAAGDGADGDQDQSGGGTDPERAVTTTVSALEHSKVMRLLQNREFPVDRAEIETIAASAYELSERECAAVIDLAVDRGLVAERDGQLVRPDG